MFVPVRQSPFVCCMHSQAKNAVFMSSRSERSRQVAMYRGDLPNQPMSGSTLPWNLYDDIIPVKPECSSDTMRILVTLAELFYFLWFRIACQLCGINYYVRAELKVEQCPQEH